MLPGVECRHDREVSDGSVSVHVSQMKGLSSVSIFEEVLPGTWNTARRVNSWLADIPLTRILYRLSLLHICFLNMIDGYDEDAGGFQGSLINHPRMFKWGLPTFQGLIHFFLWVKILENSYSGGKTYTVILSKLLSGRTNLSTWWVYFNLLKCSKTSPKALLL